MKALAEALAALLVRDGIGTLFLVLPVALCGAALWALWRKDQQLQAVQELRVKELRDMQDRMLQLSQDTDRILDSVMRARGE